jgi:hypothetical protein
MKISTFWILAIRILGVSALLTNISALVYVAVELITIGKHGLHLIDLILPLFGIALLFGIVYFFILHPWKIIRALKLNTHFEEETINISRSYISLLQVSIIIIGGVSLLRYLPQALKVAVGMFQNDQLFFDEDPALPDFIYAAILCVISWILITRSQFIARWIDNKARVEKETQD